MDLMTRAEFEELMEEGEGTRVSLFVPTHRVGTAKESDEDRLRWKNLLGATRDALVEQGLERTEIDALLQPARELHANSRAWSQMAEGLAMFLGKDWHASYRVPLDLPELAAVGSSFVLTPVLPMLSDRNYIVLTLSQKDVRVLRGSRDRIGEMELPFVPKAFDDVFQVPDGPQSDAVPRPNTSGRVATGTGTVYYGADSLDNEHQKDVIEFFREVAKGVEDHLAGRTIPMVLAGLPEWVAAYRDLSTYPHLLDVAIERNPDDMSPDDLRVAAWDLVAARLERDNARLVDRFHQQQARGTGAAGADEVARAALEGRVEVLLLTAEGCYQGSTSGPEVVHPDADDECAVADRAVRDTLRMGGAVRVLDHLPDGAKVAAVLRY